MFGMVFGFMFGIVFIIIGSAMGEGSMILLGFVCMLLGVLFGNKHFGNQEKIQNEKKINSSRLVEFKKTDTYGIIELDTVSKRFKFNNDHKIYNFEELKDCYLYKDNEEIITSVNLMGVILTSAPNTKIQ